MVLEAGLVVPMTVEYCNDKKKQVHVPTVICAYLTFLLELSLHGLDPTVGRHRYVAIKLAVHACILMLVSLSFTMSLMMWMNVVVTSHNCHGHHVCRAPGMEVCSNDAGDGHGGVPRL
jgi:hypothetical protein